jgi:hypothetical protein
VASKERLWTNLLRLCPACQPISLCYTFATVAVPRPPTVSILFLLVGVSTQKRTRLSLTLSGYPCTRGAVAKLARALHDPGPDEAVDKITPRCQDKLKIVTKNPGAT